MQRWCKPNAMMLASIAEVQPIFAYFICKCKNNHGIILNICTNIYKSLMSNTIKELKPWHTQEDLSNTKIIGVKS